MALPQRLGCLGWTLITSGLALLAVGSFAAWFLAEADLGAVLAGPGGRPPVPPPPPVLALPLTPPFVELRTQYMKLYLVGTRPPWPRQATRAAARMVEVPPDFPAVVHRAVAAARGTGHGFTALSGGGMPLATLRWALAAHLVRGQPAALPELAADTADLALLVGPRDDKELRSILDGIDLLAWAVGTRLADLAPPAAAGAPAAAGTPAADAPLAVATRLLAQELRNARERLWRMRGDPRAAELALLCATVESRTLLRGLADGRWADLGGRLRRTLTRRCERAEWLRPERDRWWAYAGATTPADLVARVRAQPTSTVGGPPTSMPSPFQPHCALARTLMTLDVLIAALDAVATGTPTDTPPAEDAFAPGHPLRLLTRAGGPAGDRTIWYSVGEDGRDDGGDPERDIVFESGAEEDAGAAGPGR